MHRVPLNHPRLVGAVTCLAARSAPALLSRSSVSPEGVIFVTAKEKREKFIRLLDEIPPENLDAVEEALKLLLRDHSQKGQHCPTSE